jgi:hypothetical protein
MYDVQVVNNGKVAPKSDLRTLFAARTEAA